MTEIVYTNESTKQFEAVLFASNDSKRELDIAWLVFRGSSVTVQANIPVESLIGFSYHTPTGTLVSVEPVSALPGSTWKLVSDGEEGEIALIKGIYQLF